MLHRVRMAFRELKKGLKNLAFNRHRSEQYESYLTVAYGLLVHQLAEHGPLELRLEASTMLWHREEVLTDDQRDSNIIYPLWREGVRLLVFRPGITIAELLGFYQRVMAITPTGGDLLGALWRQGCEHIDYVAVDSFELGEAGDEAGHDAVEVEVDEVLRGLMQRLATDDEDGIDFGRVSLADLEADALSEPSESLAMTSEGVADEAVKARLQADLAAHEHDLLRKAAATIVDVLRLDSAEDELAGVEESAIGVVDLMLLEGLFGIINGLVLACELLATDARAGRANREIGRRLTDRIERMLLERVRIEATIAALNTWRVDDENEMRAHLARLGRSSPAVLLGMLAQLKGVRHRKLVSDLLIEGGASVLPMVAARLHHAEGEVRRDLLRVIVALDAPDKVSLVSALLHDEDPATRGEALAIIARSGEAAAVPTLIDVFSTHEVAQLRAQAARYLAETGSAAAERALLQVARSDRLGNMADGEQAAIIGALSRFGTPGADAFLDELLSEKGTILSRQKVDARKLAVVRALSASPSLPAAERLAGIVKNEKLHSAEVRKAAHAAVLRMRGALLGEEAP